MLDVHADMLLLLAELDAAAGRSELARERLAKALALYDLVLAVRVRERGYVQG